MDLENSIGLEGSWRVEPEGSSGDKRDSMIWEDRLAQRGFGGHSIPPVNPIGEGSGGTSGLFSTPVKETRREVVREKREKERRPMPTAVWADLMDTSKGRDKVLVRLFFVVCHPVRSVLGVVGGPRS